MHCNAVSREKERNITARHNSTDHFHQHLPSSNPSSSIYHIKRHQRNIHLYHLYPRVRPNRSQQIFINFPPSTDDTIKVNLIENPLEIWRYACLNSCRMLTERVSRKERNDVINWYNSPIASGTVKCCVVGVYDGKIVDCVNIPHEAAEHGIATNWVQTLTIIEEAIAFKNIVSCNMKTHLTAEIRWW